MPLSAYASAVHDEAAAKRIGEKVDRYEIEAVLGAGGFGAVFRARHVMMDRQVALKLLHPSAAASDEIRERFIREARTLGKLGHPHIIDIYDCGVTDGGELFLAMQLLEGEDLADRAQRGRLASSDVVAITCQVLDALEAAHSAGIVHRDLKPANVYLAQVRGQEVVKLLDFGISKLESGEGNTGLTKTGIIMGTPHYMAPEMFSGVKDVDHRVDLYAVGVMLYELLSGGPPHDAASYEQLVVRIATTDPPSLRTRAPNLPPFLLDVVDRALQRAPSARFASAGEMRQALMGGAQQAPGFSMALPAAPGSGGPTGPMGGPSLGAMSAPALAPVSAPSAFAATGPQIAAPASKGIDLVGDVPQIGGAAPTPITAVPVTPPAAGGDATTKVWVGVGVLTALVIGGIAAAVLVAANEEEPQPIGTPDLASLLPPSAPPAPSVPSAPSVPAPSVSAPPPVAAAFPDDKPPVEDAPPSAPSAPAAPSMSTPMEAPTPDVGRTRFRVTGVVSANPPSDDSVYALLEGRRSALRRCSPSQAQRFELSIHFHDQRFHMVNARGARDDIAANCVARAMRNASPLDTSGSGILTVQVEQAAD